MSSIVYFSSVSENTRRFIDRLDLQAGRIPVRSGDARLSVTEPYVLFTPTYGNGDGKGAVPKQVITFLNDEHNRSLIRGVIAAGNTNFGSAYCLAGKIIASKCRVPNLYNFELLGTTEDVHRVREGLGQFWQRH